MLPSGVLRGGIIMRGHELGVVDVPYFFRRAFGMDSGMHGEMRVLCIIDR